MLLLILKSQLGLFVNVPVHVGAHVRKDGTRVADHMALRRKKAETPHEARQHALFAGDEPAKPASGPKVSAALRNFLTKHGGPARMARMLADMTAEQRAKLLDGMATLGRMSVADVQAVLSASAAPAPAPAAQSEPDLFSQPAEPEAKAPAPEPAEDKPAPAVPPGVRADLQKLVGRLKEIRARVDEAAGLDQRFKSGGRYEADALENVKRELAAPLARLQRLRDVAKTKGVDLEPTLAELGLPSFEPSAGAREWMDGGKKPAEAAAPAPATAPITAAQAPEREAPAEPSPPHLPMDAPARMYRSVSPEEWEAIKQSGQITGGANSFNPMDQRKHVFFGGAMTAKLMGQGDDVTRRAEYQVQHGPMGERLGQLKKKMDQARADLEEAKRGLEEEGANLVEIQQDTGVVKLRRKLQLLKQDIDALHSDGRAAITARIKELREADAARGYTSVVLETKPIDGGRRYTGANSGMGDEDEFGFDPGHVKLSDVVKVRYVKNGEVIREEAGPATTDRAAIVNTGDKLADYWANSAGASTERDVKAGRVKKVDLTGEKPAEQALRDHVAYLGGRYAKNGDLLELARFIDEDGASSAADDSVHLPVRTAAQAIEHIRQTGRMDAAIGIKAKGLKGKKAVDMLARVASAGGNGSVQSHIDAFNAAMGAGQAAAADGPREGERNAEGLVFRDGRWHRDEAPATEKDAAARLRDELRANGIKARADVAPGGGSVRVMAPAADKPLTEDQIRSIKALARAAGLTHVRGEPIADDGVGDPLQLGFYLPAAAAPAPAAETAPAPEPRAATVAPRAPFGVPAGTSKSTRRDINARVAALVAAGEVDRDLMRQYSGNGGCGDSLNEFYTDPGVAAAMWATVQRLGVTSGTAFEPSCATGVFLHTAPEGFRVTGVEMDPISNACAKALHGERHEIAPPSSLERFATQDTRQFKVVIGNPPYGPRGALARDDKRDLKTAENYFFDTALDKCEAGGLVGLVVPSGIMNSKNGRAFRERLLRKGEFLGAQRLPNSAFEASHTDVTTDVVWFRKRPDDVAGALMTLDKATLKHLGVWDDEFLAGSYFEGRGKANIFGTEGTAMRAFGEIYTVNGSMDGVAGRVAAFEPHPVTKTPSMQDILAALDGDEKATARALGGAALKPYAKAKIGDTKTEDGVTYILEGDPPRWHRVDEFVASRPAVEDARPLAAMIDRSIAGLPVDHEALRQQVQAWMGRYGIPGKHADLALAAKADKSLYSLIGAVADNGELSDAVVGRAARKIEGSLETVAQGLSLKDKAGFTPEALAQASGRDVESVTDELYASSAYAYLGGGQWTTTAQYLTGDLWAKLDQCRRDAAHPDVPREAAAKFAEQARKLEEKIDPRSLEDVDFDLSSGWVPNTVKSAFLNWRNHDGPNANEWTKKRGQISIEFADGIYTIKGGESYGTDALLDKYLNRTGVRKDDRDQLDELNKEFRDWLLTSPHRDAVEDKYNRTFRGYAAEDWSDEPFDVPGMAADDINRYHFPSLRRALARGKGIIAADVGLGKTVRGLMLARMLKMTGQAKRPTFVVPKSVLANWVAESQKWFPGSRVLVIGETYSKDKAGNLKSRPDTAEERARKYHEMRQNDYDFVFISRPTFNELDVNPILKNQYLGEDFWVQRGDKLGNAGDKRVKKVREQYEQATADREFMKRSDAVWFDQLGIDALIMDEAHAYKNLYAAKARFGEQPKFLGGQGLSNQAFDFNMKARHVRDSTGGKGVFSLTATPTKNSPLEIYSMLAPIAPEEFERIGIKNSEDFLDRYAEFRNEKVLGTDGSIEDGLVTAGFKNMDELRAIMDRHIDRTTAKQVGLRLPERDDRLHLVDMDSQQLAKYGELRAMLAEASKKDATGDAHVFSIMDKMAKAALDLELLDPEAYASHQSPKYREAAKHIAAGAADGGQVVFCEAVDAHEKIAASLVAAGIPRDQIAILNGKTAPSSAARQNISDKFNAGKLKVVIGNKTMEEGVNLQKATTDIHHLDLPWDPATMQQRNGRGLRQGNRNEAVRIHTYLSRGSFDGYRHQSMRAKKDWMDLLWEGGDRVENLSREGGFSREDLMVMMSADPEAEREKLANDKKAAEERHAAQARADAGEAFVRFQSLKRSFNGLKNKDTASAARLRVQLEKAKTALSANRFFGAKAALDMNDEVVLHPQTHEILTRDVGLEVDEVDGTKSRWVVTAADPLKGEVSMRRHADTAGGRPVTVSLEKLASGTRTFKFDKAAEAAEVRQHMERAAQSALESVEKLDDVRKMPGHVIDANYDMLQRRLKDADKDYKLGVGYGNVPMINKATGKVESVAHYSTKNKHDTHDFLLPTDAHREAATKQWMDERRTARIGFRYVDKPGTRRSSRNSYGNQIRKLAREHPGASYDSKHVNPMRSVLNEMDGVKNYAGLNSDGPSVKAAKSRLEAESLARVRKAASMREVFDALGPLATVGEDKVTYPARALAMAWAKAKRLGALDARLVDHHGAGGSLTHTSEAYGGGDAHTATVKQALMRMAAQGRKSGGLVPAMSRAMDADLAPGEPQKHREHVDALIKMADGFGHDHDTKIDAAREALRVVEKIGAGGVPKRNFLGGSYGYGTYGTTGLSDMKPLRDYLSGKIEELERAKAREAAAKAEPLKEAA